MSPSLLNFAASLVSGSLVIIIISIALIAISKSDRVIRN